MSNLRTFSSIFYVYLQIYKYNPKKQKAMNKAKVTDFGRIARLNEAFEHLQRHHGVHGVEDFARRIKRTRGTLSPALNTQPASDSLLKAVCEAFSKVFELDYLLYGRGTLLTSEEESRSILIESGSDVMDAFNQQAKTIDKLTSIIKQRDATIAELRHQITRLLNGLPVQGASYPTPEEAYAFVAEDAKSSKK